MPKTFLIFDFETSGVGECRGVPYPSSVAPLPRPNYPVQLAAQYIDTDNVILKSEKILIHGVERLDPWVLLHCADLSVKECEKEGISFKCALRKLANMIDENDDCTIVAHNIQYDWNEVIVKTARELDLDESKDFLKLKHCKQFCTCVNDAHNKLKTCYFYKKLNKWIGPNLKKLAQQCNVEYDDLQAHDAMYDVNVTRQCFVHLFMNQQI